MRYLKFLLAVLAVAAVAQNPPNPQLTLPDGKDRALVEKVCSGCHGLENVVRARMTKERWATVVDDMVSRGATATDDEADRIVNYLAANFSRPAQKEVPKP